MYLARNLWIYWSVLSVVFPNTGFNSVLKGKLINLSSMKFHTLSYTIDRQFQLNNNITLTFDLDLSDFSFKASSFAWKYPQYLSIYSHRMTQIHIEVQEIEYHRHQVSSLTLTNFMTWTFDAC